VSRGSVLYMRLLLQGLLIGSFQIPRPVESDQILLSLPSGHLHHPCHPHPLLHQQVVRLQGLLLLDAVSAELWRVSMGVLQEFRVYWPFNGLQDFFEFFSLVFYHDGFHALPQQNRHGNQRGTVLRQVPVRAGSVHRFSLHRVWSVRSVCRGFEVHFHPVHGHPGKFPLMQSIILIDLFYLAGIKLVKRYD
jgi:hypothetical protein